MSNSPVITVKQGQLKGKIEETEHGFKFNSFLGIPYAKPPVGNLRFKAPQPAESWQGIRDVTVEGENCYSTDIFSKKTSGSEDCLFLNVYTPVVSVGEAKSKAVMVWIHGGGFISGCSKREQYGPEFLIERDIVFVSINYRVGVLGFLSLADKSLQVPGNAGMKDQVLALQWVKENIHAFGGDANNITIFGESAGSVSVHLHLLSPLSRGLFHKAIMQSGTSLCPWCHGQNNGITMCKFLKKDVQTEAEALAYLMNVPVEDLITAQDTHPDGHQPCILKLFSPVVEDSNSTGSFLPHHPLQLVASGAFSKVPLIIGYNSEEGLIFEGAEKVMQPDLLVTNLEDCIPVTYSVPQGSEKAKEIAKKILDFYYGNEKPSKDNKHIFYKILSDSMFVRGIFATIEGTMKHTSEKIFLYRLSLQSELSRSSAQRKLEGVSHGEDLFYLFPNALLIPGIKAGSVEETTVQRMTKWWTNFAKYGNPNGIQHDPQLEPKWPCVDAHKMQCMDINEKLSIQNQPEEKYMKFWQSIESYAMAK